jgi:hypothetical protein
MKSINHQKQLIGKQKLGRGMSGVKGGQATPTGAFGGKSKFNKRLEKLKSNLTNNK